MNKHVYSGKLAAAAKKKGNQLFAFFSPTFNCEQQAPPEVVDKLTALMIYLWSNNYDPELIPVPPTVPQCTCGCHESLAFPFVGHHPDCPLKAIEG